jgi:hypothetical protein
MGEHVSIYSTPNITTPCYVSTSLMTAVTSRMSNAGLLQQWIKCTKPITQCLAVYKLS